MKPRIFFVILLSLALAGAVLVLGHYNNFAWIAALLVLLPPGYIWLRSGRTRQSLLSSIPLIALGISTVILVGLSKPPIGLSVFPVGTQVVLAALYGTWIIWLIQFRSPGQGKWWIVGIQQLIGVAAIFLASAFWHWPSPLVIAAVWVISFFSAIWVLNELKERAATILAAAWALVAAEISWILSTWQVNYILYDGIIIVPQASIILLGVGYCFGSIYQSHSEKRLSRRRLIEYIFIAGVLLSVIIAGTRWNGTE